MPLKIEPLVVVPCLLLIWESQRLIPCLDNTPASRPKAPLQDASCKSFKQILVMLKSLSLSPRCGAALPLSPFTTTATMSIQLMACCATQNGAQNKLGKRHTQNGAQNKLGKRHRTDPAELGPPGRAWRAHKQNK